MTLKTRIAWIFTALLLAFIGSRLRPQRDAHRADAQTEEQTERDLIDDARSFLAPFGEEPPPPEVAPDHRESAPPASELAWVVGAAALDAEDALRWLPDEPDPIVRADAQTPEVAAAFNDAPPAATEPDGEPPSAPVVPQVNGEEPAHATAEKDAATLAALRGLLNSALQRPAAAGETPINDGQETGSVPGQQHERAPPDTGQ